MADNVAGVDAQESEQEQQEQLTPHQIRVYRRARRRNIILGSIFGVGAISLTAFFFFSNSQNSTVAISSVSNVVNTDTGSVSTYDSEWFANAFDIVMDSNDIAYFSNYQLNQIYKLENGSATVFAGAAGTGYKNGSIEEAQFSSPTGLALFNNELYIADQANHKIRKINLETGEVSTVAGAGDKIYGERGFLDGSALEAQFNSPTAVVVDLDGTVYVADSENHAIRKISNGVVSTLAGGRIGDAAGDKDTARFNNPKSVAILDETHLLVADTFNNRLKKINKQTGVTENFAGNGQRDLRDGSLSNSSFYSPSDVLVTRAGNVFVADTFNHAIRVIPRSSNNVYVLTGNGQPGFKDGPMAEAMFNSPIGIAEESNGTVLVVDRGNKTIRRMR
jgi:hypothetical protein